MPHPCPRRLPTVALRTRLDRHASLPDAERFPYGRRATANDRQGETTTTMPDIPYYRLLDRAAFASAKASVGEARRWLSKVLERHPRRDDAVILLSEAVTNSVVHTRSAA